MQGFVRDAFFFFGREKLDDYSTRITAAMTWWRHQLRRQMEVKPSEVFALAFFMAVAALAIL